MRNCVAFASLVLLLVATTAHGIRLDRQLQEAINNNKMVYPTSGEASVARSVNKHCSPGDGHCSSSASGTTKNPLTHAESGAVKHMQQSSTGNGHTATTVNVDNGTTPQGRAHEAEAASHGSWQQTYPDIMDIAGMDYSPATRRSPIHN